MARSLLVLPAQGRERRVADPGDEHVVVADHADVVGHEHSASLQALDHPDGEQVVVCDERGVPVLDVGDNYYDDTQARFGLSDEEYAGLRDHGILFDRVGKGNYLQLFTQTVGGLFIEFVQRRGGYVGFGARNAPFRLAAQALQHAS